jgi:hypothetical protein
MEQGGGSQYCPHAAKADARVGSYSLPLTDYCRVLATRLRGTVVNDVQLQVVSYCKQSGSFADCAIYRSARGVASPIR